MASKRVLDSSPRFDKLKEQSIEFNKLMAEKDALQIRYDEAKNRKDSFLFFNTAA
jgi:hypothetical protein